MRTRLVFAETVTYYLCNFVLLWIRLQQEVSTLDGGKISVNFRGVLYITLNSSPRMVRAFKNVFLFCNLLPLCGDIAPNPGPSKIKYPCATCSKAVTSRQRGIECSRCEKWCHASCVNMSINEYNALSEDLECPWHCPSCVAAVNELTFANSSLNVIPLKIVPLHHFHHLSQLCDPFPAGVLMHRVLLTKDLICLPKYLHYLQPSS